MRAGGFEPPTPAVVLGSADRVVVASDSRSWHHELGCPGPEMRKIEVKDDWLCVATGAARMRQVWESIELAATAAETARRALEQIPYVLTDFPMLTLSSFTSGVGGGSSTSTTARDWPMLALTNHVTEATGDTETAFTYTVTRNFDGTGANEWFAGDAVVNTGQPGDGFIEMYAYGGKFGGVGPTIVGNVRTGTAYNALPPRWGIGNLRDLGDYGAANVYGAFFGDFNATNVTIDATHGFRARHGTTNKIVLDRPGMRASQAR